MDPPKALSYSSVVSRESVQIVSSAGWIKRVGSETN